MSDGFLLVLLVGASYRIWRLLGVDTILDRPRKWVTDRTPPKVDLLLTCPFCAGSWISFALVAAVDHWWRPLDLPVLWALTAACLVGLVGINLDDD